MYNCANLLSYSFYIESSFLLLFILHFICLVYPYVYESNKGFKDSRIQINLFATTNTLSYAINKQVID